ncbi:MAG TPA: DNA-deoxyinosine glycosylase [Gammaproteobacteria bacterium]|nr:DNA-deoxyinosine glycosylase [Gammaproteobacteria bacterium]
MVGVKPRVLILGSLPGRASLEAGRYYAQSRNAFWPIMGALCDAHPEIEYSKRLELLTRAGVALWDVLFEAVRQGSLDSSIVANTQRVNDISGLVSRHASLRLVAFNGKKAAEIFRRRIETDLSPGRVETVTLPSTSPAYASLRPEQKLATWREALSPYLRAV